MTAAEDLTGELAGLPLVDHHVHSCTSVPLDRARFESYLTESGRPVPDGLSTFDSQLGFAVLGLCGPLLDLPAGAGPEEYLARRAELGPDEVDRRLLGAVGASHLLLDTGYRPADGRDLAGMAAVSGADCREVVRLETLGEHLAAGGVDPAGYPAAFRDVLTSAVTGGAVGTKSIVGYRQGLDIDLTRPTDTAVTAAAGRWLAGGPPYRLTDPVLHAFGIWTGIDAGVPLQLHTGFGDLDLDLRRVDPLHLRDFLTASEPAGTPVMLLHCYPFHREAGYLAHAFAHVYVDVGLGVHHLGAQSAQVVAESLELAPFGKVLFSSDAAGPAELHLLGARLWRRGYARAVAGWVAEGLWTRDQAVRVARMTGSQNARRLYRLDRD